MFGEILFMTSIRRIVWLAALLPCLSFPLDASADESSPGWRQTLFIHGTGDATDIGLTEQGPLVGLSISF